MHTEEDVVWCPCSTTFGPLELFALRIPCSRHSNAVGCICVRENWKLCIWWVAGNGDWTTLPQLSAHAGIAYLDVTDSAKSTIVELQMHADILYAKRTVSPCQLSVLAVSSTDF